MTPKYFIERPVSITDAIILIDNYNVFICIVPSQIALISDVVLAKFHIFTQNVGFYFKNS